ncbi:MAG: hypothetical protein O2780_22120 [Proteobacteria bacterium]|nr:hypothetical protein [Pseudomonadota bacterium]
MIDTNHEQVGSDAGTAAGTPYGIRIGEPGPFEEPFVHECLVVLPPVSLSCCQNILSEYTSPR